MTMFKLKILHNSYVIHRFSANSEIPIEIYKSSFYAIVKTDDELSIVCDESIKLSAEKSDDGWACIKILGQLDFSLTGVLSKISTVLATANISIFAVSTYNTDYILVKTANLKEAKAALSNSGYSFSD